MASRLKMDLGQEQIFKPKELIKAHDDLLALLGSKEIAMQAAEILEKYPDVDEICQQIKEKYEYGDKDYMVIAPDRIEDIINEGYILGHCLHRSEIYFDRIQTRESYILFCAKPANRISHIIRWKWNREGLRVRSGQLETNRTLIMRKRKTL